MQYFSLVVLQLHKLTSDLTSIYINSFAGNLAEIAEEDQQFSWEFGKQQRPRFSETPHYGHPYLTDSFVCPDQKLIFS